MIIQPIFDETALFRWNHFCFETGSHKSQSPGDFPDFPVLIHETSSPTREGTKTSSNTEANSTDRHGGGPAAAGCAPAEGRRRCAGGGWRRTSARSQPRRRPQMHLRGRYSAGAVPPLGVATPVRVAKAAGSLAAGVGVGDPCCWVTDDGERATKARATNAPTTVTA